MENLPLNKNSRVCSDHFEPGAKGRCLLPSEYPTLELPNISTPIRQRRPPTARFLLAESEVDSEVVLEPTVEVGAGDGRIDVGVQTVESVNTIECLKAEIEVLKVKLRESQLRLISLADNKYKIQFYTGFCDYLTWLGPAVNCLNY
jgi:hypothetical protein